MTVTNRRKRCDIIRTITPPPFLQPSVPRNSIDKPIVDSSEHNFSTSPDPCRTEIIGEHRMTLPTPDDSTASWLDADDSYQIADFLDEATQILHEEVDNYTDACHDRLRSEYEQWKKIPHLRIVGKRIDDDSCSRENVPDNHEQSYLILTSNEKPNDERNLNLFRDRVIKIMTETLWQRVLEKTSVKNACQMRRTVLESQRRRSSGRIESALIVSSILPVNRPPLLALKSRSHILETINQTGGSVCHHGHSNTRHNKKLWSKSSVNVLPPIETQQKKIVDKTKRWFSAVSTPGRNYMSPRPMTSTTTQVNTAINVCFDISIDGKSIKKMKKKGTVYCSPS